MQIQKIEINNMFGNKSFDFGFLLVCGREIRGGNGSGKTSVLKLVEHILKVKFIDIFADFHLYNLKSINIIFDNGENVLFDNQDIDYSNLRCINGNYVPKEDAPPFLKQIYQFSKNKEEYTESFFGLLNLKDTKTMVLSDQLHCEIDSVAFFGENTKYKEFVNFANIYNEMMSKINQELEIDIVSEDDFNLLDNDLLVSETVKKYKHLARMFRRYSSGENRLIYLCAKIAKAINKWQDKHIFFIIDDIDLYLSEKTVILLMGALSFLGTKNNVNFLASRR